MLSLKLKLLVIAVLSALLPDATAAVPRKILIVSAEHARYHGSGGLGVMIEAWSKSLAEEYRLDGTQVAVMMPYYMRFYQKAGPTQHLRQSDRSSSVGLDYFSSLSPGRTEKFDAYTDRNGLVDMIFMRHDNRWGSRNYFDNQTELYAPADLQWESFAAFCKAGVRHMYEFMPDVDLVYVNDWHSALFAYFAQRPELVGFAGRKPPKIVGIVHNYAHQGKMSARMMEVVGIDPRDSASVLHHGELNNIHILEKFSAFAQDVSLTHSLEVLGSTFGRTLEGNNRGAARAYRKTGILNGADHEAWDPTQVIQRIGPHLALPEPQGLSQYAFNERDLEGMARGKALLQNHFKLKADPDAMIFVSTARVDPQKGFDFLPGVFDYILSRHPHVQIVLVGDPTKGREKEDYVQRLRRVIADKRFEGRIVWQDKFSDFAEAAALAYGDANMAFSTDEPAGQTAQISGFVGTPTVGNAVGGLKESVKTDAENRTGWLAELVYDREGKLDSWNTGANVIRVMEQAIDVFENDRAEWNRMIGNALRANISWRAQVKLYRVLIEYILRDGPAKLLRALGPAPEGVVYSPIELLNMLNEVESCEGRWHLQRGAGLAND